MTRPHDPALVELGRAPRHHGWQLQRRRRQPHDLDEEQEGLLGHDLREALCGAGRRAHPHSAAVGRRSLCDRRRDQQVPLRTASTVFVATGDSFPDALAGSPAAAKAKGPSCSRRPRGCRAPPPPSWLGSSQATSSSWAARAPSARASPPRSDPMRRPSFAGRAPIATRPRQPSARRPSRPAWPCLRHDRLDLPRRAVRGCHRRPERRTDPAR